MKLSIGTNKNSFIFLCILLSTSLLGGHFFFFNKLKKEKERLTQNEINLNKKLERLKTKENMLSKKISEIVSLKKKLNTSKSVTKDKRFDKNDFLIFLGQYKEILKINEFTSSLTKIGIFSQLTATLSIHSSLTDLQSFIEDLENQSRFLKFSTLELKTLENLEETIHSTVTIQLYWNESKKS